MGEESSIHKYEWTLKVLGECGQIGNRDNVADIAIYEEKALQPYYKIVMKDGEVKYFTVAEMNEIICKYIISIHILVRNMEKGTIKTPKTS